MIDWILHVIGKKAGENLGLQEGTMIPWYRNKGKLAVIVGVLIYAVNAMAGPVFGHPVHIPEIVIQILTGAGLYAAAHDANTP